MIPSVSSTKRRDVIHIIDLQIKNHFSNLTDQEKQKQGFISLLTDKDVLARLIASKLVFIAKNQFSKCVGYIFAIPRSLAHELVFLKPLVFAADQEQSLKGQEYYILGQICIAADFQGTGIALKLYKRLERELVAKKCKTVVTEVSVLNPRSLVFHRDKAGFSEHSSVTVDGQEFKMLQKTIS
jgi:predicted N-acetyltransferase YhbS